MDDVLSSVKTADGRSAAKGWLRALELTKPIERCPRRVLPVIVHELAEAHGDAPALLSERECFSFSDLARRMNRYARWALGQGIGAGDVVCLLMPNRPEYMAIWLGITRVGGVVALINTNLVGTSLGTSSSPRSLPRHSLRRSRISLRMPRSGGMARALPETRRSSVRSTRFPAMHWSMPSACRRR
jgi:hypothetical protein